MHASVETSDQGILDLLRRVGPLGVGDLVSETGVTATAVRQRLNRLMGQGLIERQLSREGRGRPGHRYSLSDKARRAAGSNFADLAIVLWQQIRSVEDPEIRRGLLERIATAMAASYEGKIEGDSLRERMQGVAGLMQERDVPFEVDETGQLPVLLAQDCPYPRLAEADRGICSIEKMLFSKILEQRVRLTRCRLDGHDCCEFTPV